MTKANISDFLTFWNGHRAPVTVTESAASHVSQGNADGVSLRRVSKTYGLATVLQVDELTFRNGEVTGIVGENGAGKSTMLGILAGTVTPDPGGDVVINGEPVQPGSPIASQAAGVAMVSQEFPLVGQLSVAENLTLGTAAGRRARLLLQPEVGRRRGPGHAGAGQRSTSTRDAPVSTLSIPARQLLEVAKALGRNPKLLILDEPTSALGPVEADLVIGIAREHAANGGAVIFVGHRLEEVREAADRVVVLRNGGLVADMPVAEATDDRLIKEMVGREHLAVVTADHSGLARPAPVFTAENLTALGLGPVSLSVNEGEVLGVAGLMGAGRSRLMHTIFGAIPYTGGTMTLAGRPYAPRNAGRGRRGRGGARARKTASSSPSSPTPRCGGTSRSPRCAGSARRGFLHPQDGEGAGQGVRRPHRRPVRVDRAADRLAVRRQPAAGHLRQVVRRRPEAPAARRAHPRRRRWRQGRDLRAHRRGQGPRHGGDRGVL